MISWEMPRSTSNLFYLQRNPPEGSPYATNEKASKENGSLLAAGNTIAREGDIIMEDSRAKQEIAIKLQNVERGIVEIELESVDEETS